MGTIVLRGHAGGVVRLANRPVGERVYWGVGVGVAASVCCYSALLACYGGALLSAGGEQPSVRQGGLLRLEHCAGSVACS